METVLYNGFGGWSILKNGHLFFSENSEKEWEESKTLQGVEDMIGNNETDDFIAFLYTPLRDAKYQRQGKNNWILISQGLGFA